MVKKSSLAKKLASYSAVAAAVLTVNHKADGQIIYTGLNPADTIPYPVKGDYDTSVYLDLNNDGVLDFEFEASRKLVSFGNKTRFSYTSTATIRAFGSHKDSVDIKGAGYGGSIIPATAATWATQGKLTRGFFKDKIYFSGNSFPSSQISGQFYDVTDKYLPLKFINKGNIYYGWARLTTIGAEQLIVSAYAYNSIPGSSIVAGNTGCTSTPVTPVVTENNDILQSSTADKYQWYFDGNSIAGDTLATLTPPQRGYYAVLTTDANGCLAQSTAKYFACYNVNPVISENSNYSNPSCGLAELQAVNLISGTYIQWQLNGIPITGAIAPTYFADSTGDYTAAFIDSNKTCSVLSDTVQLTINAVPPLPSLKQSCDTLSSAPTNAHISWYYEKATSDSLLNDTINSLTPGEAGNYIVDYTYKTGCSTADTLNYQSPFSTAPAAVIAATNNSVVSCQNEPLTLSLTDSIYYNQHGDSIQWYINGNPIAGANKTTYTVDSSGAYYLSITSGFCFKYSDTVQLTIKPAPPFPALKQACDTLTSVPTTANITWYYEKLSSDSLLNDTINSLLANKAGNYIVSYTDADGCSTTDTVNYQPLQLPVITTENNRTVLCAGETFSFSVADSADYDNTDTIRWYLNDTAVVGADKSLYTILGINGGSGAFYLSVNNATCIKYSDTVTITGDIENPTINQLGTDTLTTQQYTSYQWYENNLETSNGTGQNYVATTNGIYYVIVTDSLGCYFQSPWIDYTGAGISPTILPEQVSVYSYDKIVHVQFTDESLLGSTLNIYDMVGQDIFSTTLTSMQTEIDMNDFTAGFYVVEVMGKKIEVVKKIVVE